MYYLPYILNVAKLLSHVLLVNINLYYGRSTVCFRESAVFCIGLYKHCLQTDAEYCSADYLIGRIIVL